MDGIHLSREQVEKFSGVFTCGVAGMFFFPQFRLSWAMIFQFKVDESLFTSVRSRLNKLPIFLTL